jgi:far upstream element-binding protein
MSPAHLQVSTLKRSITSKSYLNLFFALQQAQHAAAQVAARLGQQNSYQQQHVVPNPDAVEKAKQLISKFIPQGPGSNGGPGQNQGGPQGGGQSRPGLGAGNNFVEIMVPGSKVGLIIGKGGETIKQLQERTGAKMVVIQDGPTQEMEKPLRISGDPQKVEHAKQLVYELIEDKGNQGQQQHNQGGPRGGGGGGFNRNNQQDQGNNYGSGDQIEVFVPKVAVGVVIGKGGDMIKKIQAETGCRLQFLQTKTEGPGDRRCILQGTKQQVDDGRRMIEDLIDSVIRRNEGGGNSRGGNDSWNNSGGSNYQQQHSQGSQGSSGGVQVVQHQYQFIVPASKCGIIIGRGGDTIKQINQQSGAHCEMDRKASQNQTNEKTFTIKGEQHQVDEAKRLIQDKINMDIDLQHIGTSTVTQSSNGFGQNAQNPYGSWGGSGGDSFSQGGWDQSQGSAPQMPTATAGQPDYSLQWIEYYRSMGKLHLIKYKLKNIKFLFI